MYRNVLRVPTKVPTVNALIRTQIFSKSLRLEEPDDGPDLDIMEIILRYDDLIKRRKKCTERLPAFQSRISSGSIMDALASPDGSLSSSTPTFDGSGRGRLVVNS